MTKHIKRPGRDSEDPNKGEVEQGITGDAAHVTSPRLDQFTTANRLLIAEPYPNLIVYDTDLRSAMVYIGDGTTNVSADWRYDQQITAAGAAHVSDAALDYKPYSDATYTYGCEAIPGTALATASWRIFRSTIATSRVEYATGGTFTHAATDLAAVQGAFV